MKMTEKGLLSLRVTVSTMVLTGALASAPLSAGVTDDDIMNDAKNTSNVVGWGIGPQGQRYSPLNKINKSNVARMVPAWTFSFGGEKQRGQEAQPLVYNGKMFVTGSYSRMWAIDLKTGRITHASMPD